KPGSTGSGRLLASGPPIFRRRGDRSSVFRRRSVNGRGASFPLAATGGPSRMPPPCSAHHEMVRVPEPMNVPGARNTAPRKPFLRGSAATGGRADPAAPGHLTSHLGYSASITAPHLAGKTPGNVLRRHLLAR